MSGVFISYRRADAQGWAGRINADLTKAFGEVAHYFDMISIRPGADFEADIARAVDAADAVLVLIGPGWLEARSENGERRLDLPTDLVAAEVAMALRRPIPVIPVLLGGTSMPAPLSLPQTLRELSRRNAIELSDARWAYDSNRLLDALEASTPLRRSESAGADVDVSVGAGLKMTDGEVGNVIGVRGAPPTGSVNVLGGASLTGMKMGDIVGVEITPTPRKPRS